MNDKGCFDAGGRWSGNIVSGCSHLKFDPQVVKLSRVRQARPFPAIGVNNLLQDSLVDQETNRSFSTTLRLHLVLRVNSLATACSSFDLHIAQTVERNTREHWQTSS